MGRQRRKAALIVTGLGLATFVSPLIWTDSEILGQTRWSPLQIVLALHAGTLPIAARPPRELAVSLGIDFLFGFGLVYLLLAIVAAAIVFLPSVRFIAGAAGTGAAIVLADAKFEFPDFQQMLYGMPSAFASDHQVHAVSLFVILLGVEVLLLWIAATKQLDSTTGPRSPARR